MDALASLAQGFAVAGTPTNLLFVLIGVTLGQVIGALPGIGPSAGMALLLPVTFGLEPVTALVMLSGIMYGGMYGGTLTSVLVNVPGEAASVMTAVDGNQLARQGRAGQALAAAAIGSFIAGIGAVAALVFLTPALAAFALSFSAPEYFLLALLGITATASLGTGSAMKAMIGATLGLMIALVGTDPILGTPRLTFGSLELMEGIDFLPVAIGIFGIAEILVSMEQRQAAQAVRTQLKDMWLSAKDWAECRMAILRGGIVGFLIGLMPGAGPTVAALLAYVVEKKASPHPERFGHGALDGVAAAESANNSAAHGAMVPMLALGIPGSASTAVLLAALVLLGIRPGPMLLTEQADLVWGLIASMFIGNVILLVINLPLAPLFASVLRIPYSYLVPGILVVSLVGAYAISLSLFNVGLTLFFGMVGYLLIRADIPRAPLVLAVVLAPLMESSLRQSLMLSEGSLVIFVQRPLAALLALLVIGSLALPLSSFLLARRAARRAGVSEALSHSSD
ncbi:tripartite tricarboxylate transporter permease [Ancylobacter sp. MQZ15Z-1]|uniref:Tripartite tricarboxylate transporter permease n=1 Tax=Ancylobacter mangrovi TaxID=2972472 RepID=A0A9X2PHN6_9HYPH|nr:tripartite tricarboxylate transporter permease [Ancylobacter mangrovi]MCS0496290.1 tripartite tricarboxylate transporter permease [Ancylobacter mangrovi]